MQIMLSSIRTTALLLLFALLAPAWGQRADGAWASMAHTSFRHHLDSALGVGTTLAQDRSGFIWMGTQTGLIRWDGFKLRRYLSILGQAGSLPDSYILSTLVDGGGRLWVGTSSGGLARYDAARDQFVTIAAGPAGLSHARVSALAGDGAGGIWVGTGGGLERIGADGAVHAAASGAPQIATDQLPKGGVEALLRDRAGALWIGTRHGLFRRGADREPVRAVLLGADGAPQPSIHSLYQDEAGRVWIGTRANGAFVQDKPRAQPRPVLESGAESSLQNERVFSIVEKTPGIMWLGTEGGGIVEVDTADGRTRRIRHLPDTPDSLHDDDAVAMLRERSGQIFVATVEAMSQHDPRPQGITTVRAGASPEGGKLSVPTVLMRPDGRAWLAVSGGAINIIDPLRGSVAVLRPGADPSKGGLPKGRVLCMANGPDGTVFIGTQQGLFLSDADGANIGRLSIPTRSPDASVWALAYRDGVLWLGGLDGLWAVRPGPAPAVLRHEDRLGDSRVTAILPLADGSVWVGTRAGLARLDGHSAVVELLPSDATDASRMPPGYVSSLIQDRKGRLWVSTFSTGIAVLERTDARGRRWFKRISVADGLPDNGVNVLVQDNAGIVWLSTDNGLARVDPADFAVRKFGEADGVHVPTYWTGSGARSPSGLVLFGGLTGLTVLHPERIGHQTMPLNVAVTDVVLGGRSMPPAPFNAGGPYAGALTLAPADRERGISLEFAALDFAPSDHKRYAYRLKGFDGAWIDTDASLRRVSYNNLPPGDYVLELRVTGPDGGAPAMREVPVRVLPAWHQEGWVHLLAALALAALLAVLVQARTSLLRRRQRELEATVAERTAELRATQAKLETMAYADALTGLPNRRLFNDELRRMAAQTRRGTEAFSLLLIDLDHFKSINDTLGHDAGDALLLAAATRLRQAVREVDRVVRLGGDEFAVLLAPGSDNTTIGQVCLRIVDSMSQPVTHGAATMRVSASVGAATFVPGHGVAEIYKAADLALYRAKEAGRNTWCIDGLVEEVMTDPQI